MSRKIALLSDGTGNSVSQVWRTNVWRTFERLDLSKSDQIAFYDDGVGTSSFKPLALLGGAFGYGLKRNVIALYKFACRNYRSADDEIFLFGFSRGAFTVRIVVGMILDQGLVCATSEEELDAKAIAAYRAFRRKFHTIWHIETPFRWARDLIVGTQYSKADNRQNPNIRFLGLWDTVAAYGMPIEEMANGIGQWLFPWYFPDYVLDPRVKRACHALSIDDERTTFHPVLWDERNEAPLGPREDGKRYLADERISQVWFPGAHSNIGGGYPEDSVAQIPLIWIMTEAQTCGLRFKSVVDASPQTFKYPTTAQDKDGRIYDPRSGFGGYYRYGPRDLFALSRVLLSRGGTSVLPRIHESALARIQNNAHSYAPRGIPGQYEIVTSQYELLSPQQNPCEKNIQAQARENLQRRIWNVIWLRRVVYFLTIGVSLYLIVFPLLTELPQTAENSNPIRWVSNLVRFVGGFLPDVAETWTIGYARDPVQFVAVGGLLGVLLWCGTKLSAIIHTRLGVAWQAALASRLKDSGEPRDPLYRMRTSRIYIAILAGWKNYVAPFLFAFLFAYLGLALVSRALFIVQDNAGWVCRATGTKESIHTLAPGEFILANRESIRPTKEQSADAFGTISGSLPEFKTDDPCMSTGVWVERGRRYRVTFQDTESFYNNDIPSSKGASFADEGPTLWHKTKMLLAAPLLRTFSQPWFRVVARVGDKGGEEAFLGPDPTEKKYLINVPFTATRDGELFLYVNDAVLGIPWLRDFFYGNNKGSTRVLITRL